MRVGSFRHALDIDAMTPLPVPWSFPDEDAGKRPKYPAFKSKPFPMSEFRYKPLSFDPYPHKKNPDVKGVSAKHQLKVTSTHAKALASGRTRIQIDGGTYIARLRLRPGEKITGTTNVYVAKVLSPKEAGTSYPVYILRIQPDMPVDPGKKASSAEQDKYITDLLKYQYKFDRATYWENVRIVKEHRAGLVEQHRKAYEDQLAKAKKKYYTEQAKARIEYERKVSEAKAKYQTALREYQISKIGSYYGNKYFSLYGSYFD